MSFVIIYHENYLVYNIKTNFMVFVEDIKHSTQIKIFCPISAQSPLLHSKLGKNGP